MQSGPYLALFVCGADFAHRSQGSPVHRQGSWLDVLFLPLHGQLPLRPLRKQTTPMPFCFKLSWSNYGTNTFRLKCPRGVCYWQWWFMYHSNNQILNSSFTVNSSLTFCMNGFKNALKAFVSLNRDWFLGTELKLQVSVSEPQVSKTGLY